MTEDQANKKWCPFTRMLGLVGSDVEGASGNRLSGGKALGLCIASGCMAWRWTDVWTDDGDRGGYCGLAGKI